MCVPLQSSELIGLIELFINKQTFSLGWPIQMQSKLIMYLSEPARNEDDFEFCILMKSGSLQWEAE